MDASRRDFIKQSAAAAALSAAGLSGGCRQPDGQPATPAGQSDGVTWQKGVCRFCGTGCGILGGIKDGRMVALRGDPDNPVNRGLLCVKGYHAPEILYGEDRLTKPLIRRDGKLTEASWDEALDLVASKYKEAMEKYGPTAVAFYGSGQWTVQEGYAALKFMKGGLGSNNIDPNARLCMASAVAGFITTFGGDEPMGCYEDFEHADAFVLWGHNAAEMHPVLYSRMVARKQQAKWVQMVDIATRRTRTTEHADLYLEFVPQTDLAIANCIANLIIQNGWVDRDFVERHVTLKQGLSDIGYGTEDRFAFKDQAREISFDEFARFVADYTPERVEELSKVPADKLRQLARIYGDPDVKVVSTWCMGVNQHTRGTWMNNLIYNLHLLTGKICKPGSNPLSVTGQPSACGTCREVGTLAHTLPGGRVVMNPEHRAFAAKVWGVPADRIPAKPGYHAVEMFRALDRGDIRVIWIQVTNPFHTLPNLNRFRNGAQKDDRFIVVSDVYPTRSTEVADVVLPSSLWVEKEGVFGNTERRTQHWEKMVDPPGEARPDVWQTVEVARRMGLGDLFDYGDTPLEEGLFEEYRQFTLGVGKDLAPYDVYRKTRGLLWPVVDGKETKYRYAEGYDPYVAPGAGIDFYKNKKTGHRAVIWARPYEPPAESPDEEYPFWLCTGRVLEHWHTGSMTRRVPELHRAVPGAYVELHPADAQELQVANGDRVKLISRRGELELTVSVNGRSVPQRGLAFVPFFDEEALVNMLTLDAFCPISKEPDYKKCAVRIVKA